MNESEWVSMVVDKLHDELFRLEKNLRVEKGRKLRYAYEVKDYENEEPKDSHSKSFETDILIYETANPSRWKPRIVIEGKIGGIITHDAITYSQKAIAHKNIHPYLRYGILLGNYHQIPGRLFRHGSHFDFMLSWQDYQPSKHELNLLIKIVRDEIEASRHLEEILFHPHSLGTRTYIGLHRPLILEESVKTLPDRV